MQALAKSALATALLGLALAAPVTAFAKGKSAFRCVNEKGTAIVGVSTKTDCAAPNRWVRLHKKSGARSASAATTSEKKSSK